MIGGVLQSHCGPDLPFANNDQGCTFNGDGSMSCDNHVSGSEGCDDPLSVYDGRSICASEKNACTRAGGSFGFVGAGSQMNAVCVPFDDGAQIPTCADLSAPIQSSAGDWRCLAASELEFNDGWLSDPNLNPEADPDDTDGDGVPNALDPTPNGGYIIPGRAPSDIDGDGIPDLEDGDMDGDGINNGSDDDADGDGILNEDDPTPDGDLDEGTEDELVEEEEGEETEVTGGSSCDASPMCSGPDDACSIVIQMWKTRCATEELAETLTEEVADGDDGGIADATTASNALIDSYEETAIEFLNESSGIGAPSGLGGLLTDSLSLSFACRSWDFNYLNIEASITCEDTAPLRELLSWVAGIFTLIAVFEIATRKAVQ
jgi:hypothetical protein